MIEILSLLTVVALLGLSVRLKAQRDEWRDAATFDAQRIARIRLENARLARQVASMTESLESQFTQLITADRESIKRDCRLRVLRAQRAKSGIKISGLRGL